MTTVNLEALGISKEELTNKLLDRLVEDFTTEPAWDHEDGAEYRKRSTMSEQITKQIKAHIDAEVQRLGDQHVLPRVTEIIEGLVIQTTNSYGEKRGEPVTFIEYLISAADAYMREDVDYNGKPRARDSYNWSKHSTRITYMVDKHLQYSIEIAMKKALADANSAIVGGLEAAVKHALKVSTEKLSVTVKTK
jgi:hypothetical protein